MAIIPKTRSADRDFSLIDLNVLVSQLEDMLGPLIAISNDGNQTILTFDAGTNPPDKHTVIAAATTGAGGGTKVKVATGEIFIKGTLTAAIATRPA